MLSNLLIYFIIGIIIVFVRGSIHYFKVTKMKITYETIKSVISEYDSSNLSILEGLIVWPIRIMQFDLNEYELINKYIDYQNKKESE